MIPHRPTLGGRINAKVGIILDARHRVTGYAEVARGTLNSARLRPRDVFAPALLAAAAGVIAAHNHPSGTVEPSQADRHVTAVLRDAGTMLGVPLLDHLIVTATDHFSFRQDEGWGDIVAEGGR